MEKQRLIELEDKPVDTDGRGNILYRIYGQDGEFVHMRCEDTPSNRLFVIWLRQHDRYTPRSEKSHEFCA